MLITADEQPARDKRGWGGRSFSTLTCFPPLILNIETRRRLKKIPLLLSQFSTIGRSV
jgi:hypothetical protein